ncbi:hypothetical protein ZOSMA_133G00530 [Zostera marina]|uniref:AT3G52170-like helix-turn-helix domain-containing protein n=1 Tax=Zostera marina TaxID=29655 RepID=A0A0K9PYS9_ZOSMR|nr:hypothetical protein ZOSMA_133G00530 [Zostera marina]
MRGGGRLARLRATSVGTSLASFSGYAHCHSSSSTHQFRSDFLKKLLWYGRHHSSSFSNSTTSTPLKRRMVKKDIRRAKVEAFVEKYKADNGGKYPKVTVTKKEVGGSYYTIREIMQKLIYESNHSSSMKEMEEPTIEKSCPRTDTIDSIKADEPPSMNADKASADPKISVSPMYHSDPDNDSSKRHSGDPKDLANDKKIPKKGSGLHRHDSGVLSQEKPLPKNSSIWSNMKSFIFNFWKNT